MTTSDTTMIVEFTTHDTAPHEANCDSVSMSEVTRATSTPRLDSLWWASDSLCTWENARVRSPKITFSAVTIRRM